MAEPKKVEQINSSRTVRNSASSHEAIKQRQSHELIVAICGAIGSGVKNLRNALETELKNQGYETHIIAIREIIEDKSLIEKDSYSDSYERYKKLQDCGDKLRKENRNEFLAEMAIAKIAIIRNSDENDTKEQPAAKHTRKVAYIIDQLKHPDEVKILNSVYRNNFYLLGLLRNENERSHNLKQEGINDINISELMLRDKKGNEKHGQQVEKTIFLSDYFIRNIDSTSKIKDSCSRFVDLIHGTNNITPKHDETGMFAAYSSSLKSSCLSRQVGASITDENGDILAVGCNDVPKFGGGLYSAECVNDQRCFNSSTAQCHNDRHKNLLKNEIKKILDENGIATESNVIAEKIINNTKAKSLIEYSRAVHAEMDAIIALARSPRSSTTDKILYCTTYPCHNCTRHIIAAGIKRVVFIEPYEKSLAKDLHSDAICHSDDKTPDKKVLFENFEGVSPSRYDKFFRINRPRKDSSGKVASYFVPESGHVDYQQLDSYIDYELKVIETLKNRGVEI